MDNTALQQTEDKEGQGSHKYKYHPHESDPAHPGVKLVCPCHAEEWRELLLERRKESEKLRASILKQAVAVERLRATIARLHKRHSVRRSCIPLPSRLTQLFGV